MHKIFQDLNLPGSTTRPVIIPRSLNSTSSNKAIALQLELPFVMSESNSTDKKE
ncbi:hypothetical protein [Bacillus sp. B1-b2]|uniref:hypothetical protein n=1 Tax=Bacillus sp. B1-b2 TaxID=2653201 RepID=UPI00186A617D|nr:hypothetical protein [Bacillus sp. B1-b2]